MATSQNPFEIDQEVLEALQRAQWAFAATTSQSVYALRLELETPAVVTAEKANAPVIGLPSLDGFLSYVAFQAAFNDALQANQHLSTRLIWQWNTALRNAGSWISFQLPLRTVPLPEDSSLFDCSVGLPVDADGNLLVPAGAYFVRNGNELVTYPEFVDSVPLRRRVSEPFGRPIALSSRLQTKEGTTKALDNRLYFPLTTTYVFFFRGDKEGVERLLDFALDNKIGIGKKTTLGYGQIKSFVVEARSDMIATWAYPIFGDERMALIKSLPFDYVYARRQSSDLTNLEYFGCEKFAFIAATETLGTYRPPYWIREHRTQIIRYGSIIQKRQ